GLSNIFRWLAPKEKDKFNCSNYANLVKEYLPQIYYSLQNENSSYKVEDFMRQFNQVLSAKEYSFGATDQEFRQNLQADIHKFVEDMHEKYVEKFVNTSLRHLTNAASAVTQSKGVISFRFNREQYLHHRKAAKNKIDQLIKEKPF